MSEYTACARGPLKLKTDGCIKKKKNKKEKKNLEQVVKATVPVEMKRTKAEMAFLKQQETLQKQRILEKASMTHKQRVEEFNRHLDGLTEHFDIPKVSWTK